MREGGTLARSLNWYQEFGSLYQLPAQLLRLCLNLITDLLIYHGKPTPGFFIDSFGQGLEEYTADVTTSRGMGELTWGWKPGFRRRKINAGA